MLVCRLSILWVAAADIAACSGRCIWWRLGQLVLLLYSRLLLRLHSLKCGVCMLIRCFAHCLLRVVLHVNPNICCQAFGRWHGTLIRSGLMCTLMRACSAEHCLQHACSLTFGSGTGRVDHSLDGVSCRTSASFVRDERLRTHSKLLRAIPLLCRSSAALLNGEQDCMLTCRCLHAPTDNPNDQQAGG